MDYTGLVELESTAADSAAIGKGTFLLADIRETVESGGYAVTENGVTKNYKTYLVRRLADGNCWMVQNLDLNLKSFAGTNKLTSENTDLNSKTSWDPSASLVVAGGYNNALGEGNAKISNILEPGPGYSSPDVGQLSISDYQFQSRLYYGPNFYWGSRYTQGTTTDNPGTANNNGLVIVNNTNSAYPRSYNDGLGYIDGTSTEDGMIKIGNISGNVDKAQQQWASTEDTEWRPSYITDNNGESYTMRGSMYIGDFYNYYAATAESITYYMTSGSAQDTICPSGWTIPNAYLEKSFSVLMSDTYGIPNASNNVDIVKKTHLLPLSIPYTGAYNWATGSIDHNGYRGFFWAKGEYAQDTARNLGIHYTGDVSYGGASQRIAGVPIRCVNKGSVL